MKWTMKWIRKNGLYLCNGLYLMKWTLRKTCKWFISHEVDLKKNLQWFISHEVDLKKNMQMDHHIS